MNRLVASAALCIGLTCAANRSSAQAPGAWFFNARNTGTPPAHFVVGGSRNAPPLQTDDVRFGWSWRERGRNIPAYPEAPSIPSDSSLQDAGSVRTWTFERSEYGFPSLGVGPAGELWILADSAHAPGWADLLDAVEAAHRQRLSADTSALGVLQMGTLGACPIFSVPVPYSPHDNWSRLTLPGGARRGRTDSPFLALSAAADTPRAIEVRRFLRWLPPDDAERCARGVSTLRLFPVPAGNPRFYLNVDGVRVEPVSFARLAAAPWLPGLRALSAETGRVLSLRQLPGNGEDLCADPAAVPFCDADLKHRRVLYTALGTGGSDALAARIEGACQKELAGGIPLDLSHDASLQPPTALCGTSRWWKEVVGGVYRTYYTGPWWLSTDPQILSRIEGGEVQWIVARSGNVPRRTSLTLPGHASVELRLGAGTSTWAWIVMAVVVGAAVAAGWALVDAALRRGFLIRGLRQATALPTGANSLDEFALQHIPSLQKRVLTVEKALGRIGREPLHLALLGHEAHLRCLRSTRNTREPLRAGIEAVQQMVRNRSREDGDGAVGEALAPLAYVLAGWYLTEDEAEVRTGPIRAALDRLVNPGSQKLWPALRQRWAVWRLPSWVNDVLLCEDEPLALVVAAARWAEREDSGADSTLALPSRGTAEPWSGVEEALREIRKSRWSAATLGWRWHGSDGSNSAQIHLANLDSSLQRVENRFQTREKTTHRAGAAAQALKDSQLGWLLCGRWLREVSASGSELPGHLIRGLLHARKQTDEQPHIDPMWQQRKNPVAWLLLGWWIGTENGTRVDALEPQVSTASPDAGQQAEQQLHVPTLEQLGTGTPQWGISSPVNEALHQEFDRRNEVERLSQNLQEQVSAAEDAKTVLSGFVERLSKMLEEARQLRGELQEARQLREDMEKARKLRDELRTEVEQLKELLRPSPARAVEESPEAVERVRQLIAAAEIQGDRLDRVLELAGRLPDESLLAFLDPRGPFVHDRARRISLDEARATYEQAVANFRTQTPQDQAALTETVAAGARLGSWINSLWNAFSRLAGDDFAETLMHGLLPPAQQEWLDAYNSVRAFGSFDAVRCTRLHYVFTGRLQVYELPLERGFDAEFLEGAGLTDGGLRTRLLLRSFLVPRKERGPLDAVVLGLQYLVEAYPREHRRKKDGGFHGDLQQVLRAGTDSLNLPHTFHTLVSQLAKGIGLRYQPVPYYESRIDQEPHRSAIEKSVGALSLTGKVGYQAYTDPQKVVRLERPFFFEDDTYYSGYAYVARDL